MAFMAGAGVSVVVEAELETQIGLIAMSMPASIRERRKDKKA
jgi:hypothetical protein